MIRHSSSASTRRVSTLVPPMRMVAKVVMRVAMWNIGPELRYTVSSVMRWTMATMHVLGQHGAVGELGAVGHAAEGPGVELDDRPVGVTRTSWSLVGRRGHEALVGVLARRRVVLQPAGRRRPSAGRASATVARRSPLSCQMTTLGAASSSRVTISSGLWRQLAGEKTAPILAQAHRPSITRWQFCPSHSTRSPRPTPAAARALASWLVRRSRSG